MVIKSLPIQGIVVNRHIEDTVFDSIYRYEDIALVMMPKEDIFELTAEHKTYKVYTPKVIILYCGMSWVFIMYLIMSHIVLECCL